VPVDGIFVAVTPWQGKDETMIPIMGMSLLHFATSLTPLKLALVAIGVAPAAAAVSAFRKVRRKAAALAASSSLDRPSDAQRQPAYSDAISASSGGVEP